MVYIENQKKSDFQCLQTNTSIIRTIICIKNVIKKVNYIIIDFLSLFCIVFLKITIYKKKRHESLQYPANRDQV